MRVLAVLLLLVATPTMAQDRGLRLEGPSGQALDLLDLVRAENPDAPFEVDVALSGQQTVVQDGEAIRFRITSQRAGFLTLVNRNPDGAVTLLYPNKYAPAQRIEAGEDVYFPAGREFVIRASAPFGQELVKAIVTPSPLVDSTRAAEWWGRSPLVSVEGPPPESAGTDLGASFPAEQWATSVFYLTTAPTSASTVSSPLPDSSAVTVPPADGERRQEDQSGEAIGPVAPPVFLPVPSEPTARYSDNPGRTWRAALRSARRENPGTRSLTDEADGYSQRAWEPPPPDGPLAPHDASVLVLYKPAVGTRSFGTSLQGGGVFGRIRSIEPGDRDVSGTRSLAGTYGSSADAVLRGLQRDPDVLAAIPNYQIRAFGPHRRRPVPLEPAPEPDSADATTRTLWPLQWGLHNAYWRSAAERVDLGWLDALASYQPIVDRPVIVAVLDSGLYPENPHLAPVLWKNEREVAGNGLDDDGNGFVDDTWGWDAADDDNDPTDTRPEHSHGTFVASQIAGSGALLFGMAPDVEIMAVRVLGGEKGSGYQNLITGIRYAAQNGARVLNLSLGAGPNEEAIPALERMLSAVFEEADKLGALVVISAGNESSDSRTSFTYPARVDAPNTLSVAALNMSGRLSGFSNYGPHVDVAAPGDAILGHYGPTLGVEDWGGTSMAAPYVTALAAMLFAEHPDWTPAQVKTRILETARPLGLDLRSGAAVHAAAALADDEEATDAADPGEE